MLTLSSYTEPALSKATEIGVNQPLLFDNSAASGIYEVNEYEPGEFEKLLAKSLYETNNEQPVDDGQNEINAENEDDYHIEVFNAGFTPAKEYNQISEGAENLSFESDLLQITDEHFDEPPDSDMLALLSNDLESAAAGILTDIPDKSLTEEGTDKAALQEAFNIETSNHHAHIDDGNIKAGDNTLAQDKVKTVETAHQSPVTNNEEAASISQAVAADTGDVDTSKERISFNDKTIEEPALSSDKNDGLVSLKNDLASENFSRNDDKNRSNRRDRLSVEVRDLRTGTEQNIQRLASADTGSTRIGDMPVRELTLELKLPEGQHQAQSMAQTTWEVKAGSHLENMLARELHQNFNGDIVRHASMALKDGGEGIIRLALKPESLGNVKIALELSENKITGQIIVESEEALNAFKRELSGLEQAFKDSGYEEANLNLSLANDGSNKTGEEANEFIPFVASRYNDTSPVWGAEQEITPVNIFLRQRPGSINMFA